ncbi:MAG: glycosyltransferase [Deltaproteobacteria bacterium]|jgi:glycosyltransferase involved in cell wall biosynthesis|nr:glycosyltransferase [Deltaproteobacteria bacterium]
MTNRLDKESLPSISIIIPVYKTEKYLARCLDSVLAQTFSDFEIVCVNDGSPDNSAVILADYEQRDVRIKVVAQENQGLSVARNNGVLAAKGKYILYLDSDDVLHPQTLEIAAHFAKLKDVELVVFKGKKHFDNDHLVSSPHFKHFDDISKIRVNVTSSPLFSLKTKDGQFKIDITAWGKLFKREILANISFIPKIRFEDTPYIAEVLSKNPTTAILEEKLYSYTQRQQSIMSEIYTAEHFNDHLIGVKKIYDVFKNADKKTQNYIARVLIFGQAKYQVKKFLKTIKLCRADKNLRQDLEHALLEQLRFLDSVGWLKLRDFKPESLYWYARMKLLVRCSSGVKTFFQRS